MQNETQIKRSKCMYCDVEHDYSIIQNITTLSNTVPVAKVIENKQKDETQYIYFHARIFPNFNHID